MGLEVGALLLAGSSFGTLTIGGFSLFQAASLLITFAVSGAQMIYGMMSRPKRPPSPLDPGIKQNVRQTDAPQRRVYGEVRTGGAIFFYEARKPHLYVGYAYNAGLIEGISAFQVNGKTFRVDSGGNAIDAPFYRADGSVFLKVSVRSGSASQGIDPMLATDFPALPASFRQRGEATAVFRAHYGNNRDDHDAIYGNGGGFDPLVTIKGARVYDPRDPSQDRDSAETWKRNNAASLILADYICDPKFGRVSRDRVDWRSVALAANRDEETIALKDGGWQKRYTINGVVDSSQQPAEVIRSMLSANRGRIIMTGGMLRIISGGQNVEPCLTIHDGMVIGAVEFRSKSPRSSLVNRVKTEFIASEREWSTANGPVYDRPDLQDEDGSIYEHSIALPFTESHQRAQRLAKSYMLDARFGKFLTTQCSLDALELEAGDIVRVDLAWMPAATGLYMVEKAELTNNFTSVSLSLSEFSASIENDWTPETDEQTFEISPAQV